MEKHTLITDDLFKVKVITCKDIAELSDVSMRTAQRIYSEIKKMYQLKRVTMYYYIKYYCVD